MSRMRIYSVVLVLCSSALLGKALATSNPPRLVNEEKEVKATTRLLGGPDRYLTFIDTDKPIYRAGEKVYIRGVVLNASTHKPLPAGVGEDAAVEIRGPRGQIAMTTRTLSMNSVWSFAWQIPDGQAGGEYTIHSISPFEGEPPAERKFDIRAYRAPRLNSHITFLRDGYGPGEKVTAALEVSRAEGGVPEGARVSVTARLDGTSITGAPATVGPKGLCSVSITLPREIARGDGTLALVIQDGGVVETAAKTIPILLHTVDMQMFPESGDLVVGFPNRVYVQANQTNGKPADLVASVVTKRSADSLTKVTEFRTEHEGRGRFTFVPERGRQYFLKISKPDGIKTLYPLPAVKATGAVIRADRDVYKRGQPITVRVGCTQTKFSVTLAKREKELSGVSITTGSPGKRKSGRLEELQLSNSSDADGVLIATVWDENGLPLAERLLFREPAKQLVVTIKQNKQSYVPGDSAKVTIKTTDPQGKPVSAIVGITVSDNSVLQMIEKREQAPRLPAMVFLEPEVKDLADAQVYMDPKNPKGPLAVDLLLGTQGWRRFAFVHPQQFMLANGEQGKRVLAMKQAPVGRPARSIPVEEVHGPVFKARFAHPLAAPAPVPMMNASRPMGALVNLGSAQRFGFFPQEPDVIDERRFEAGKHPRFDFAPNVWANRDQMARPGDNQMRGAAVMARAKRAIAVDLSADDFVPVRQFAHHVRVDRKPADREDFTETLYWNAAVKTDAKTGEGTINFGLNDSVTTFDIFADAFTNNGAIGAARADLKSAQPFYAEAKMPLEVTAGDRILLPISLVNGTSGPLSSPQFSVDENSAFKLSIGKAIDHPLTGGERVRSIQRIDVLFANGLKEFLLHASAGQYSDKVLRKLLISPKGFPTEKAFGGILEPGKPMVYKITIEKNVVPLSITSNTAVYPTPLANMDEGLERLIVDPNGCFEQTSSTSYPLTMAQQYFLSHSGVDPALIEKSRQKLDVGYKKLVGFWCPDRGYEWFGQDPGHEALTAFGLLHFNDMSQVRDVDKNMVATTRAWLMKQKDGQGGFTRKRRSLHTWITDKDCSNSYIVWALLETGEPSQNLATELSSLKSAANASKNNYVTALAANAFELSGDKTEAKQLMDRLSSSQQESGAVGGITDSIVGSGGESLAVEGTALATLAWLREPQYAANAERSIKFLADSCKNSRYGSTQATVLALRAIVAYDKAHARPKAPGKVRVSVDGQPVGDWVAFDPSTQGALKLPDISELMSPGDHNVELVMDGGSPMPFSIGVKYNALTPESSKDCKLNLTVALAQNKVVEGATTEANVTVTNIDKEPVPTPIAIVGLPGGLEPRHDQLKELVKKGTIDSYEVRGRDVVLYWRSLPGNATAKVPLSLIAAVPGSYSGTASRAYLYYTDEHKKWVDGMHVDITPKSVAAAPDRRSPDVPRVTAAKPNRRWTANLVSLRPTKPPMDC